jgi:small nuclear ribonucleoprotein G
LDKTISLQLNKGRNVSGTLRGYDQFMNVVLADAIEEVSSSESKNIGMVVSVDSLYVLCVMF